MHVVELLRTFALTGEYNTWHKTEFQRKTDKTGKPDCYPQAARHLQRFFDATMDDVRLFEASSYVSLALALTDVEDYDHFRRGVLRREVSGEIAYQKQRDHSGHTLYNYVLGWYFYSKSPTVKNALHTALQNRGIVADEFDHVFADIWAYASLLHDIGYLFEGNLAPLSSKIQDDQIRIGADVSREYFNHRFWTELGLAAVDDRFAAQELSKVRVPELESQSMTGLGYSLRSLGNLDGLRQVLNNSKSLSKAPISKKNGLAQDAFWLWRQNYEFYGPKPIPNQASMSDRIQYLEDVFHELMQNGFAGIGIRVLDHGVCSGLLLLQAATFYFQMAFGPHTKTEPDNEKFKRAWKKINDNSAEHDYVAEYWWQCVVWASAATAIHNIAQMKPPERLKAAYPGALAITDDPLAYLGILVDILQEWDRNFVSRASALTGDNPLQGIDVAVVTKDDILEFDFGSKRNDKIRSELTSALIGWEGIVEIKK